MTRKRYAGLERSVHYILGRSVHYITEDFPALTVLEHGAEQMEPSLLAVLIRDHHGHVPMYGERPVLGRILAQIDPAQPVATPSVLANGRSSACSSTG